MSRSVDIKTEALLPLTESQSHITKKPSILLRCHIFIMILLSTRRGQLYLVIFFIAVTSVFSLLVVPHWVYAIWTTYPPLYEEYHRMDLALPQHDPSLPSPEGRNGKYLLVSSRLEKQGWGNDMQELVLDAYLAHKAGMAFVFDNYTWSRHGPEYSRYNTNLIPSRIPLSVLIAGPIVGGSFPNGDVSPRSVREEYFRQVCPNPAKIKGKEVTDQYVWGSTTILVEKWLEKFASVNNRCIEIVEGSGEPFTFWTFGTTNVLDIWPDLVKSPMLTAFVGRISELEMYPYTTFPGLLVLQVRRGDFDKHCNFLFKYKANWHGLNKFPQFPDQFTPAQGEPTASSRAEHMKRCYPTPKQIAARVQEILQTDAGKSLDNVYIMTNGKKDFIAEVKEEVGRLRNWKFLRSSRDIVVDHEQVYVKQAIDMLIGLRSDVIIGNGWSSMSSNIAMLRMALLPDLPPDHTRYW
ncbi:hypothetical protein BXZ70DRAFT_1010919 [Cristinia sonorae]|uniref:Uncharacterized protein n=1 Tax=Cristinia sonorae TaxID=1940300 RepID=A0A8K0UJX2_9AGAR|nr:hypothetical protein BXZ70DRAFT_1010919 [Cristinia sonorae]